VAWKARGSKASPAAVSHAAVLSPGGHHEGIVYGDTDDVVDALGADCIGIDDIAGQVLL
jgi:hypothetical protein